MSQGELQNVFDSQFRQRKQKEKDIVRYLYTLADLCAYSIARVFNEDAEYEPIDVYFPELFDEEREIRLQTEKQLQVERFLSMAHMFNKRFEEK